MRDAMSMQRRRRILLMQSESTSTADVPPAESGSEHDTDGYSDGLEIHADPATMIAAREQLFRECQGRAGVQLMVELAGSAQPIRVPFDRPYLLIGSDRHCDLRLDHSGVSPRHVYLQWVMGRLFCSDLGSDTGLLAGSRTGKTDSCLERHPIQVGPCRLWLEGDDLPDQTPFHPLERSPQLMAEFPQVRLKFDGVEQTENQWPVDRPLTLIGRGPQCKLRLDHPEMPPVLASLLRTSSGCWLIDLAGAATTLVNDVPVELSPLDIGDRLQLGPFSVTVTAAAFGVMESNPTRNGRPHVDKNLAALANRHRELIMELSHDLREIKSILDAELLEETPQLRDALEQFVLQAGRHYREMHESLEPLTERSEPKTKKSNSKSGKHS